MANGNNNPPCLPLRGAVPEAPPAPATHREVRAACGASALGVWRMKRARRKAAARFSRPEGSGNRFAATRARVFPGSSRSSPPHSPQCAHWGTFPPRGKAVQSFFYSPRLPLGGKVARPKAVTDEGAINTQGRVDGKGHRRPSATNGTFYPPRPVDTGRRGRRPLRRGVVTVSRPPPCTTPLPPH